MPDARQRGPVVLLLPLVLGAAAFAGALTTGRPAAASPTLTALGKELFFSTTAWGQQPSRSPELAGQRLACASCHTGPGYTDGSTHPTFSACAAPPPTPGTGATRPFRPSCGAPSSHRWR